MSQILQSDGCGIVGVGVEGWVEVDEFYRLAVYAPHDRQIVALPDGAVTQLGFATGLVCLQFAVGQSFAFDIQYPTLKLGLGVHSSNIVATHELGNVAMQMLGAELVVRAMVATLHQSPEGLNSIRVCRVANKLTDGVLDRKVVILLALIRPVLISMEGRSLLHVLANPVPKIPGHSDTPVFFWHPQRHCHLAHHLVALGQLARVPSPLGILAGPSVQTGEFRGEKGVAPLVQGGLRNHCLA